MPSTILRLPPGSVRLVNTTPPHNKFYDILLHPHPSNVTNSRTERWCYTCHYGRIGTAGATQTKVFNTLRQAENAYVNQVKSKTSKGYVTAFPDLDLRTTDFADIRLQPAAELLRRTVADLSSADRSQANGKQTSESGSKQKAKKTEASSRVINPVDDKPQRRRHVSRD